MYAFPSVFFSEKVLKKAKELNVSPDFYYCMEVLKNTGIVIVPGRFLYFKIKWIQIKRWN